MASIWIGNIRQTEEVPQKTKTDSLSLLLYVYTCIPTLCCKANHEHIFAVVYWLSFIKTRNLFFNRFRNSDQPLTRKLLWTERRPCCWLPQWLLGRTKLTLVTLLPQSPSNRSFFFFTNKTLNIKWILFLYFINVFDIRRHMDFINVMTYDLHGPWEKITGHNSPLYARRDEMGPDTQLNIVNMATTKLFL